MKQEIKEISERYEAETKELKEIISRLEFGKYSPLNTEFSFYFPELVQQRKQNEEQIKQFLQDDTEKLKKVPLNEVDALQAQVKELEALQVNTIDKDSVHIEKIKMKEENHEKDSQINLYQGINYQSLGLKSYLEISRLSKKWKQFVIQLADMELFIEKRWR